MNAPSTIDADRVQALNRLIREKTGRADSGPEPVASPRKNLWLQVPAANPGSAVTPRPRRRRSPGVERRSDNHSTPTAPIAQQIRRTLTVLLSAALLLTTAATAFDLLTEESRVAPVDTRAPGVQTQ